MNSFDVVIIGSGPGGYVSAIRCAQLGFKTAIIEKYPVLGGTCLNVGCIPSKSLLASSHHYSDVAHFADHGIEISGEVKVNLEKMIARKQAIVDQTTGGVKYLMDKNKITVLEGLGSFVDATHVAIAKADGTIKQLKQKNIIIATGSKPANLPFIKIDKERIITSTEALKLKEVPKHLVIIGGGVIGIELGQVYLRLGAKVSVVEYMDRIIPGMDASLSKELTKVFKKQGMKFYVSHKVQSVERNGDAVTVQAENAKGETITLEGDYALVSVGRRPYTHGLGAENAGVKLSDKGMVEVNDHLQTNILTSTR
jgi:dihydrolipoamide dehydrogenase